jgi:hypothetical protein
MDNNTSTPIVPFDETTVKTVYSFSAKVNNVILHTSAKIMVQLNDENNNLIDIKMIDLDGNDYLNWGSNDDYITNYVAQKLGFTINK